VRRGKGKKSRIKQNNTRERRYIRERGKKGTFSAGPPSPALQDDLGHMKRKLREGEGKGGWRKT